MLVGNKGKGVFERCERRDSKENVVEDGSYLIGGLVNVRLDVGIVEPEGASLFCLAFN